MNEFTCSCGKHYRFDLQTHVVQFNVHLDNIQFNFVVTPTAAAPSAGEASEERAEQLVSEMMSGAPDQELAEAEDGEGVVATIPVMKSSKPAAAKAAPDSKTRPAPAKGDDDLEAFKISPTYLVALGVLAFVGFGYLAWGYFGGPATPAALEARALSAPNPEDRKAAANELVMRNSKELAPFLRRIATQSQDPEVLAIALVGLTNGVERSDLQLYMNYLEHPDAGVRDAAGNGLFKFFGKPLPGGLVFRPNAPADERAKFKNDLETMVASARALTKNTPK